MPVGEKENPEEIFLAKGQYKDYTNAPYTGNFQIGEEGYYPVVFTLTDKSDGSAVATGNLRKINTYLSETLSAEFEPNVAIDKTYSLSWKWASEGQGDNAAAIDSADTLLGNLSADNAKYIKGAKYTGATDTAGTFSDLTDTDYSTNLSMELVLEVSQKINPSAL